MENRSKFFMPTRVRYSETDMQGHVFFGHYLTYFDMASTEYLKAIGYTYNAFLSEGVDFFYIESLCQYKSRAFFDEVLHVHVGVSHIGNTSFKLQFAIYEETTDRLICTGHIAAVVVDKESHKPVPVPQGFRSAVDRFDSPENSL